MPRGMEAVAVIDDVDCRNPGLYELQMVVGYRPAHLIREHAGIARSGCSGIEATEQCRSRLLREILTGKRASVPPTISSTMTDEGR